MNRIQPLLALFTLASGFLFAQQRAERTIEEIKTEAIRRAENGIYPLIGLDPADVREAFQSIHTRDKDEWAAAFMAVADRYRNDGEALEKTDPAKANADYIRAWRLYSGGHLGRQAKVWPDPVIFREVIVPWLVRTLQSDGVGQVHR